MLNNNQKGFLELLKEAPVEEKPYDEFDEVLEEAAIEPTHEVEPHKYYEWND